MSKQNYVGQYFVGVAEDEGNGCNGYDIGECVWQGRDKLLCVTYVTCSAGQTLDVSMVIPTSIAKHFPWYKTFAEFYQVVRGDSRIVISKRVPNKSYNEVIYHDGLPSVGETYCGREIAQLTRYLKERPEKGADIVDAIIAAAEKKKEHMALIDSLVQSIHDAELSDADIELLASKARSPASSDDPFGDGIPF